MTHASEEELAVSGNKFKSGYFTLYRSNSFRHDRWKEKLDPKVKQEKSQPKMRVGLHMNY